jgi:hypothetical protein
MAMEKVMAMVTLDPLVVALHFERRQKAAGRRQKAAG